MLTEHLGLPDEETMACEDGLVENHHYRDLRFLTWEDYHRFVEQEQALLDYDGDLGSDEAMFEFEDNEVYMLDLDPGVATTVAAIAASGGVPVSSCNGGPGHYETHPLVFFWCPEVLLPRFQKAADQTGVNLTGTSGGILVWHENSIEPMREFAKALATASE